MSGVWCAIAGFSSGVLGSMGLGGGGILILYFALFTNTPQDTAQGINLLFFIPIGIFSLIVYHKQKLLKWRVALPFALFGIVGSLGGTWLCAKIDNHILSMLFGVLLIIMGLKELFSK
ncbi:hypothetical protein AGMMS50284_4610 [Clostridia bacterium]|nr:hypothetical protein AGMMS50284_4610 [Clostridia bacterium]